MPDAIRAIGGRLKRKPVDQLGGWQNNPGKRGWWFEMQAVALGGGEELIAFRGYFEGIAEQDLPMDWISYVRESEGMEGTWSF